MRPIFHALLAVLVLSGPTQAYPCTAFEKITAAPNPKAIAEGSLHRAFNVLEDPSQGGAIDPAKIAQRLKDVLSDREIKNLGALFHQILVRGTITRETNERFPNAAFINGFAKDNLNHVSLIYRALEASEKDLNDYLDLPLDVALLNAAAHDVGKISPMLNDNNLLTLEQREVFQRIFPQVTGPLGFPSADFITGHILAHDTFSSLTIENVVMDYAKKKNWSADQTLEVIRLLQAASSAHNAGYEKNLPGSHFWQSNWPNYAKRMQAAGFDVETQYPQAKGGAVPLVMAMVDRLTSLHPSFVEKVVGQGSIKWSADSVADLLVKNATDTREEVDSIAKELNKYKRVSTQNIHDMSLMKQVEILASAAQKLGEDLRSMNDFNFSYTGRPKRSSITDTASFILYKRPGGSWMKVSESGDLTQWSGSAWTSVEVPPTIKGKKAAVLMQAAIGYPSIDTQLPATLQ